MPPAASRATAIARKRPVPGPCRRRSPLSPLPPSRPVPCMQCMSRASRRHSLVDPRHTGRWQTHKARGTWPPMRLECVMVVPRILGFHARQPSGRKGSWGFCCSSVMSCLENPELEPEERHKHCAAPPCLGLPTRPAVCVCPIAGSSSGSSGGSSVRARHDWNWGGQTPAPIDGF